MDNGAENGLTQGNQENNTHFLTTNQKKGDFKMATQLTRRQKIQAYKYAVEHLKKAQHSLEHSNVKTDYGKKMNKYRLPVVKSEIKAYQEKIENMKKQVSEDDFVDVEEFEGYTSVKELKNSPSDEMVTFYGHNVADVNDMIRKLDKKPREYDYIKLDNTYLIIPNTHSFYTEGFFDEAL